MIVFLMTGIATCGCSLEDIIGVATGAGHLDVCAGQFEGG
jgi:hypothetical protein